MSVQFVLSGKTCHVLAIQLYKITSVECRWGRQRIKNKPPNFNICWLASKVSETLRPSLSSEDQVHGIFQKSPPGRKPANIWLQIHLRQRTQTALMASCRHHPPISARVWKFPLFCTRLSRLLEALEPFSHMWLLSQLQSNGVRGWQRLLWNVGSEVTGRKSCVCPQRMSADSGSLFRNKTAAESKPGTTWRVLPVTIMWKCFLFFLRCPAL